MLSQSRINQATKQFLDTLNQISNQILTYYFQSQPPTSPYKMKRHLIQLYTFVYQNCTSKPSYQQKMYQTYKSALLKHLIKYMQILNKNIKQKDYQLLYTFNLIWQSYYQYLKLLTNRIFVYLNRFYIPANDLQDLLTIGKNIFIKTFLAQTNIHVFIRPFIRQLQRIRITNIINHTQLLKFTEILIILDNRTQLYTLLQKIYFVETEKYYRQIFQKHCNDDPMVYLNYVNNLRYFQLLLAENSINLYEEQQQQHILNRNQRKQQYTFKKLKELFNRQLIKKYTQILITQPYGFNYLLTRNKIDNLRLLTQVYQKQQGFQQLKKRLFDFIIEQGNIKLIQKSKQIQYQQFLNIYYEFYKNYHQIIILGFNKNTDMLTSFNGAIQKILIKFDRITQDLYKFIRSALDSNTFNEVQQKFIAIFQKLPYKDQFINLYRSSLQKKIISGNLIYLIQKQFIQKIHKICDNQQTSTLNKILEDSIESMPKNLHVLSQNFNVKIVSLHFWEKKFEDQLSLNLTLIEPLTSTWKKFQNSYTQIFPKRKLNLLPYQTKILLKVYSSNRQLTVKCNLFQASIIYYIATSQNKIDETNIINDLTIEKTFLHRFLQQFPNLIMDNGQGYLTFNWNFQTFDSMIDLDSKVEQEKKVTKHIKQDRDILIQCAIVKIAKKKKELTFEQLVIQVNHLVKLFKPHPSNIKAVIQNLKKKDMIEENQQGKILYKE